MTRWHYEGDVSLEYGGTFYDVSDWKHGYVSAIEVTDLDSATGFRGAVMIERKVINIPEDKTELTRALDCCGLRLDDSGNVETSWPCDETYTSSVVLRKGSLRYKLAIAYACLSYGFADPDGFSGPEILQLESDGPMKFDSWKADKRLRANASLRNYVKRNYLKG